jgi:hypothetical protein
MEETELENTEAVGSQAKGEVERLAAENAALREEIRMRVAAYDFESRLAAAGARSPGLLANDAKGAFQFGEDGKLVNTEALIERMRGRYPEQFGRDIPVGSIDAGAGRSAAPPLTRETLSRMSPADIQRLDWDEVKSALAEG